MQNKQAKELLAQGTWALIPEKHRKPARGAGIGAVIGATIGSMIGGPVGAVIGASVMAGLGAAAAD
ncbi:MAG: hypothetical protein IAE78_26865 [Myxococcus sp.]|nr:hypothetical protein [Myxococcus sp.]